MSLKIIKFKVETLLIKLILTLVSQEGETPYFCILLTDIKNSAPKKSAVNL